METRRFLVAIGLSVLVLVAWQFFFAPEPPPPQAPVAAERPAPTSVPPAAQPGAAASPGVAAEPLAQVDPVASTPGPVEAEIVTEEAEAEERVVVEGATFRAEFTNLGAQLVSYRLTEHPSSDGDQVDLVRARLAPPYPFALRAADRRPSPLNEALFVVERSPDGEGRDVVAFRYGGPLGSASKRFAFRRDGLFDIEIQVAGGGEVLLGPGIRNPGEEELASRFTRRSVVYRTPEELEQVDPQKVAEPRLLQGAGLRWFGIQDTYFLTALVPATPVEQITLEPVLAEAQPDGRFRFYDLPAGGEVAEEQKDLERELQLAVRLDSERFDGAAYWGPKKLDRLEKLPYGLEESVNLGFFGILSRPLLWGLEWIYANVVGNYGWAIILMTIVIRLVLFPLTHKSFVSMQKMQKLNPKMQSIRQKYRPKLKDKQGRPNADMQRKMNEEIMGLYKKEGVNPAGGCLPMLLQIPVLFAFYTLLSTAIELRAAPWMFWITDLSAKDPLYVLPIVMGASQFVQQKLTPSSADPMQRRIFMLMPVFFTVLFLGFPSGLVLYWLTNNLLGIVQQWTYRHLDERRSEAESGKGPRTKSSKESA